MDWLVGQGGEVFIRGCGRAEKGEGGAERVGCGAMGDETVGVTGRGGG